jgi:hypothetical protein
VNHLLVPAARVVRWFENFESRHGPAEYGVADGVLTALAADGSTAEASPPFDRPYRGEPDPGHFASAVVPPATWGVLLVRKGGFAVARLKGGAVVESKVGQRHVQGRTKAGGQSQQRFARRRDNQATAAYAAAADHAARILVPPLEALVTGGDAAAVDTVLGDSRLKHPSEVRTSLFLPVPDPRRAVLEAAVDDACAARIAVTNA